MIHESTLTLGKRCEAVLQGMRMRMAVSGEGERRGQAGMRRARVRVRVRMRMSTNPHRRMTVGMVLRTTGRGASGARRLQVPRHVTREASQLTRHRCTLIALPYLLTPALLRRPPAALLPMIVLARLRR